MSDDLLATLNRRTAIAAARAEAAKAGLDAERLLDGVSFHNQLSGLDPDDAGFPRQVAALVRERAAALGLTPAQMQAEAAAAASAQAVQQVGPRQWTDDDVVKASPQQMTDAINAGLLRDLGYGPRRRRH